MNATQPKTGSRTALIVLALIALAIVLVAPGVLILPRMGAMGGWPLVAPLGLMSLLNVALAVWVGIDAERRCGQGLLWGLLVLFTSIVGLIVYLLVCPSIARRTAAGPRAGAACPSCRAALEPGFNLCPYCGERLERACPGCSTPVRGEWRLCPRCGRSLEAQATASQG